MPELGAAVLEECSSVPDSVARRRADAAAASLRLSLRRPMSTAVADWAAELTDDGGDTPLLGTGLRAGRYEALLWNAARDRGDRLLITGLLVAPAQLTMVALGRALMAGDAVVASARLMHGEGPAAVDVDTLGCAAVACLVGELGPERLREVLDVATSLMSLSAPAAPDGAARVALLRAGHPAAAGWLACEAVGAGLTGLPDGLDETLATVTGPPRADAESVGAQLARLG